MSDRESKPTQSQVGTADDDATNKWAEEALFTPGLALLSDYGRELARLDRAAFLERITLPHMLISGVSNDSTPALIMTRDNDAEQIRKEVQALRVAPLSKRPDSNTFTMMITIGRTDNNDIVLKHSMISKFHAYFRDMGGTWTFCDAGSRNGTTMDGRRLAPERSYPLKSGCQIQLGGAVLLEYLEPEALYETIRDLL